MRDEDEEGLLREAMQELHKAALKDLVLDFFVEANACFPIDRCNKNLVSEVRDFVDTWIEKRFNPPLESKGKDGEGGEVKEHPLNGG